MSSQNAIHYIPAHHENQVHYRSGQKDSNENLKKTTEKNIEYKAHKYYNASNTELSIFLVNKVKLIV